MLISGWEQKSRGQNSVKSADWLGANAITAFFCWLGEFIVFHEQGGCMYMF
jgi:hypothetical protein